MQKSWGFYGRNADLSEIDRILDSGRWFFCAISGRRRIGKTTLIHQALRKRPDLDRFYVQIPDSDERGVVQAFQDAFEDQASARELVEIFQDVLTFSDLSDAIETLSQFGWVVIIDEFQYFHRQALSPFTSLLQAKVDRLRDTEKGGIFVLGSIHTELTAVLEDRSSPLFNRVTHRLHLNHWDFETLFEMFARHGVINSHHWLFLWGLFEGVPKFYRDVFERGLLEGGDDIAVARRDTLRGLFFEGSSPLRDEATNWFLRELRGRYDSILQILARAGTCSHAQLKAEYDRAGSGGEKQLGGYLAALIDRYGIVEKLHPVFATKGSRKARYVITDNFLSAWLKAIGRNVSMARVQPIEQPAARADKALMSLEGFVFEKMIRLLLEECSRKGKGDFSLTDLVRGYWNRADGSDIEIDIVALNEDDRIVRFGSCKRSADQFTGDSLAAFQDHVNRFLRTKEGRRLTGWTAEQALYCPAFADDDRRRLCRDGRVLRDLNDFKQMLYPN